jgi:hypothetical protein
MFRSPTRACVGYPTGIGRQVVWKLLPGPVQAVSLKYHDFSGAATAERSARSSIGTGRYRSVVPVKSRGRCRSRPMRSRPTRGRRRRRRARSSQRRSVVFGKCSNSFITSMTSRPATPRRTAAGRPCRVIKTNAPCAESIASLRCAFASRKDIDCGRAAIRGLLVLGRFLWRFLPAFYDRSLRHRETKKSLVSSRSVPISDEIRAVG